MLLIQIQIRMILLRQWEKALTFFQSIYYAKKSPFKLLFDKFFSKIYIGYTNLHKQKYFLSPSVIMSSMINSQLIN